MHRSDIVKVFAATGAGGSIVGAITHDQVLTWSGTTIAVGSAVVTGLITAYHQLRAARRDEDAKDRNLQLEAMRELARTQCQLESRIEAAESRTAELAARIEQVRCRNPLPDGSARCGAKITDDRHDT